MPSLTDTYPSRDAFRWVGGMSHINSSQRSVFHWNTVEYRAYERTFYGTGLTVSAAENSAKVKAEVYIKQRAVHKDSLDFVELLCGHAPGPGNLYR